MTALWLALSLSPAFAQHHHHQADGPVFVFQCAEDERLNIGAGTCDPLPKAGEDIHHIMLHGNAFLAAIRQDGPRGRDGWAAPNMLMIHAGRSFASRHFLSGNLMLTAERWTFPRRGYPELLQTGEADTQHEPYVDAQHPHSSPVMGLTFSDTVRLSETANLSLSFAPRGESTEGPVAFMHRPTGMVNPDAPLGHHIGQDVGHISSTVLAASLNWSVFLVEASVFNGREPEPDKVDLPLGTLDSAAGRVGWHVNDSTLLLASYAYVHDPEAHAHAVEKPDAYRRHSFSVYNDLPAPEGWRWQNALIYGRIQNYDLVPNLTSFAEEFLLQYQRSSLWGRFEVLERTDEQLQIPSAGDTRHWINVATIGYSHRLWDAGGLELSAGASVSEYFMPETFQSAYGRNPWATKVFLQLGGMKMLHP